MGLWDVKRKQCLELQKSLGTAFRDLIGEDNQCMSVKFVGSGTRTCQELEKALLGEISINDIL